MRSRAHRSSGSSEALGLTTGQIVMVAGLVAILAFLIGLRNGFAYDDSLIFHRLQAGLDVGERDKGPYRLLTNLTFGLDWTIWKSWQPGYHLTSILLHGLASGLVALTAQRLSRRRTVALACGVLFAVHPAHVEAVASFANRKDILALIFSLAALNAWIGTRRVALRYALTLFFFALGVFSKEVAVIGLPVVLLAAVAWLPGEARPGERVRHRRELTLLVPIVGAACATALIAMGGLPDIGSPERIRRLSEGLLSTYGEVVANWAASIPEVFRLLLFPERLSADYPVWPRLRLVEPRALLGVMLLMVTLVVIVMLRRRYRLATFGALWTIVMYLPASNVVQLTAFFVAERYLYVPSFGVCLVFALLFSWTLTRARETHRTWLAWGSICLLGGVLAAGGWRTASRTREWRDHETLWNAALESGYSTYRVHRNLAVLHRNRGELDEAEEHYRRVVELFSGCPGSKKAEHSLTQFAHFRDAEIAWKAGRLEDAMMHYDMAQQLNPADTQSALKLAWLLVTHPEPARSDPQRAYRLARSALEKGWNPTAFGLYTLAAASAEVGRLGEAVDLSKRARALALKSGDGAMLARIEQGLAVFNSGLSLSRARELAESANPQ